MNPDVTEKMKKKLKHASRHYGIRIPEVEEAKIYSGPLVLGNKPTVVLRVSFKPTRTEDSRHFVMSRVHYGTFKSIYGVLSQDVEASIVEYYRGS